MAAQPTRRRMAPRPAAVARHALAASGAIEARWARAHAVPNAAPNMGRRHCHLPQSQFAGPD